MRKRIVFLLSVILLLATILCGCQKSSETTEMGGSLTKREWAGLLGDKFGYNTYENTQDFYSDVSSDSAYYNEIQACAEWAILPEKGTFQPDDQATWRYAIETSVRAIGIEKLNNCDVGMEITEDNLIDFFVNKIANVDTAVLDTSLTMDDSVLILSYAYNYAVDLILPQKFDYTYNEGVKEAEADSVTLKGDGVTAIVRDSTSYQAGDMIYIKPSEESPAYAVRVNAVSGNEITYEQVGMEDIYQEVQVSGTYEATVFNIEPAEGVTISMGAVSDKPLLAYADNNLCLPSEIKAEHPVYAKNNDSVVLTGIKKEGNNVKLNANLGDGVTLNVAISNITVSPDVDFGILKGLKKANVTMSFDDSVKAEYQAEHMSKQVPLGTIEMGIGPTPLTAKISLVANLGFDGKVTLTYSSKMSLMVNYEKGKGLGKSVSNNNPKCDFHADATVTVEPCLKAELCFLGRGITNAKVISGVVAIANVDFDLLGNDPNCIDVYMYVPLRWAINEDGCIMADISNKLKASGVVWDSENSPINQRYHWEDGQLVESCTRGKDKVETEPVDEEGKPYDEYKIFDFEEIVFGFIKVASQTLYLSEGESMAIGILTVPDGYSTGELLYQSENASICSVSGGTVKAISPGSTILKVSTPDGKFSVYVGVIVEMEYNDTSGFQSL